MIARSIKAISILILLLAFTSVIGNVLIIQNKIEPSEGIFKEFFLFPSTIIKVFESNEIRSIPPTFEIGRPYERVNNLSRDIFGLNSYYQPDEKTWEIRLTNFRNDSIDYKWKLDRSSFKETDRLYPNSEPRNPILLEDRHIIVNNDETFNLYRLDAESKIVWHNTEKRYHHAMNLDADGNIWICSTEPRVIEILGKEGKAKTVYDDNFITKIDVETGEILQHKSTSEILIENGYRSWVYGFSYTINRCTVSDPLHLNDIEPVLTDGPYWKKGDVFLSFRHRSLVFLYRPATNKIIRLIHGPFLRQHDVDILNDSTISIFNNEGASLGKALKEDDLKGAIVSDVIEHSKILHYHFADSSFSEHLTHHFSANNIFTDTQGFHQYLSDGTVYVEQHGHGFMYFMNDQEILYRNQGTQRLDNFVERPHWIRLYENIHF